MNFRKNEKFSPPKTICGVRLKACSKTIVSSSGIWLHACRLRSDVRVVWRHDGRRGSVSMKWVASVEFWFDAVFELEPYKDGGSCLTRLYLSTCSVSTVERRRRKRDREVEGARERERERGVCSLIAAAICDKNSH